MIEYRIGDDGDDGCWEWLGAQDGRGYGAWGRQKAHRRMWENTRGPIPVGLELDHLCRNPICVNPEHLEPVTHAENVRRGMAGTANRTRLLARTHCIHGHEFTDVNTSNAPGYRRCLQCARRNSQRSRTMNVIACSQCGRDRPHQARGMCGNCYKKWRLSQ